MTLDTTGSIATHIAENFVLPNGVSGNLVETVDCARIDVQNFTGNTIGANSIDEEYQSAIKNLSTAAALDSAFMWAATVSSSGTAVVGGGNSTSQEVRLGELEVKDSDGSSEADALKAISSMSKDAPQQFRGMAIQSMKSIGRGIRFARSLS